MARRIVFLSLESPLEGNSGPKLRDLQNIRLLGEHHPVEVLTFGEEVARFELGGIAPGFVHTIVHGRNPLLKRVVSPLQPPVAQRYSAAMEAAIQERYSPGALIWVSSLAMAQYIPAAKRAGYEVVFDEHTVESHAWMDDLIEDLNESPRTLVQRAHEYWIANQCRRHERRCAEAADRVIVASDLDLARLNRLAPRARATVIPSCVDVDRYAPVRARTTPGRTLLFTGTLSQPTNTEGLRWFTRNILPRLRAQFPEGIPFRVVVAGAQPAQDLLYFLHGHGIEVVANPPSILPLLEDAAAVFVPMRSGGGTRMKILEAMACAIPVVSTGKGAEGLLFSPTRELDIADQPDHFARSIVRVMTDAEARKRMGTMGYEAVRARYDWRCARGKIAQALGEDYAMVIEASK